MQVSFASAVGTVSVKTQIIIMIEETCARTLEFPF